MITTRLARWHARSRCSGQAKLNDAALPNESAPKNAAKRAAKRASDGVQPLLPVELGPGRVKFAQGVKAGRWVFATGLMAQDFVHGIAPDVLAERAPHAGLPKREKEAARIFKNLDAVLRAAGTDNANLVRTDQYYTTVKAVPPYQQVRREHLRGRIPPSTSITQQGLLLPGADMTVQAMGIIPSKEFSVEHFKHAQLQGRPTSGYSAAVTAGYALLSADTPHWVIVLVVLIAGCIRSIQYLALNTISYADVPAAVLSKSTSVSGVAQQLARGFGIAVGAALLAVIAGPRMLTIDDFRLAFYLIALLPLLSAFGFLRLSPVDGAEVSGHHRVQQPRST